MPWKEETPVSQRREMISQFQAGTVSKRELCRRFGVSAKTAYKWLHRYELANRSGQPLESALADRSRRPHRSPLRTPSALEERVLQLRRAHPAWGGRKLARRLQDQGYSDVPSPSTITAILARHGLITAEATAQHKAWQRFEHAAPNQLWQMDFKGDFALGGRLYATPASKAPSKAPCGPDGANGSGGPRCYPLTVLDDHSRFALCLQACADQQSMTVQEQLQRLFERYGLPERITMDNGTPWGVAGASAAGVRCYTRLEVWLLRLGIRVSHSRPFHPQTQGKDERFHRTLVAEVLAGQVWHDLQQCQERFSRWRPIYNYERPHQALGMATPGSRYTPSPRPYPQQLPALEYGPDDVVRKVQQGGEISWGNRIYSIGRAFYGQTVALRPVGADPVVADADNDGRWQVYFCQQAVAQIDLRAAQPVAMGLPLHNAAP